VLAIYNINIIIKTFTYSKSPCYFRLRSLGVLHAGGYPMIVGSGGSGGFSPFHSDAGNILSYLYGGGKPDRVAYMAGGGAAFPLQEEPKPSHSYIGKSYIC